MDALNLSKDDRVKLKPCPFCSSNPVELRLEETYESEGAYLREVIIRCEECDLEMRRYSFKAARSAWNRRHDETPSEFERLCGREKNNA